MSETRLLGLSINIFSLLRTALLIIVITAVLIIFVGVPLPVSGNSMVPNFQSGEIVVVEKLSYWGEKPIKRGDVVAARFPADPAKTRLIKRVIGLPGELVEYRSGTFYIDNKKLVESYEITKGEPSYQEIKTIMLKAGEYFLVGDNRPGSSDSRLWGPVQREDILGRVAFTLLPIKDIHYIDRFDYSPTALPVGQ